MRKDCTILHHHYDPRVADLLSTTQRHKIQLRENFLEQPSIRSGERKCLWFQEQAG